MRKQLSFVLMFLIFLPACVGPDGQVAEQTPDQSSTVDTPTAKGKAGLQEFKTTGSGLKYRVIEPGQDPKPTANAKVMVHYRGWLPDKADPTKGEEFDSSYKRGQPAGFPLKDVIPGWTEGLQLIGKGGKLELEIPPDLAYGERGSPGAIPPNATLRFEVELLDIKEPPKPMEPGPVDPDAPKEFSKTDSGLQYRILRKGNGKSPVASDKVTVHYRGWLPNKIDPSKGEEFDSSYQRGETTSFPLGGVIPGWTEGLQLVKEGGMIELEIPSELAYGEQGSPGAIPPNATLRFLVELISIAGPATPGPVDADAPKEFSKTDSGLQYRIRRKGNGKAPIATDEVTVHYRGWLPDKDDPSKGEEFDSSYQRGETTSFGLNQVIPGWTEGLQLVKEGGMIELHIPSELAYGERGAPGAIPPNSDLRFLVELKQVH